jgi:hypothetical protein
VIEERKKSTSKVNDSLKSVVFKEPGKETLRYKCAENKGNTYLLR